MPFTPFHFGPGALAHAIAPRQISFLSFVAVNVLIDIEPLYFMATGQDRLHRFFHTYVGATLAILITVALFAAALWTARRVRLPNIFSWQTLTLRPVTLGVILGAYSHIALDSMMHVDIRPLAPFSQTNVLYLLISIDALQNLCLASAVVAGVILLARKVLLRYRNGKAST